MQSVQKMAACEKTMDIFFFFFAGGAESVHVRGAEGQTTLNLSRQKKTKLVIFRFIISLFE